MSEPNKNIIIYESFLGPITIVRDESLEPSSGRFMQSWKTAHVAPDVFDAIKNECIAMGLLRDLT